MNSVDQNKLVHKVESDLQQLYKSLDQVMGGDKHRLSTRLQKIRRRAKEGKSIDHDLSKWLLDVERSQARLFARRDAVPSIEFPEELPISAKRELIAETIDKHQVVILAGETGSGKTTQIPKICLALGRGVSGLIGHTQPRRLAARTVASRIAEELNTELGQSVGYQVRFTDQSNDNTHIKLMTDGILLAEIQNDRYLSRYDTIIIDEAHERSLNIDFLLGYLKQILPKRPDLKVIITSATIDLERFSEHFDNAPVIEVSGRTYPVEVLYRPPVEDQDDMYDAVVLAVDEILQMERSRAGSSRGGDILVFMSGEREIRETANSLRKAPFAGANSNIEILPLYARLSLAEQVKIFKPGRGRRIVISTNVAETSLTVPGIRYVIDPGFARISRYSYRTKVQRLPIEAIAQASANQRMGRCGRVSEGVCIRLYSEEDFNGRPAFTDAEILRTNLAAVILQMLHMRMGGIEVFPFVDPPDSRLINDGFKLLQELQAVNQQGQMTNIGRQLSRLPVDPRLGRMMIAAKAQDCVSEMLIIASALSVQDVRERPAEKRQAADENHRRFNDEKSDFMALVNLWHYCERQRQELTQNQLRKLFKKEFISFVRLREWRDIHHQLRLAIKTIDVKENIQPASYESVHQTLLSGLLGNLGFRQEDKEYLGARNRKFHIFPGSSQFKKAPKWMVAGQLLETAKLYAHNVAKIEPDWALKAAVHLVKRNHFEPHYDSRSGQVKAFEKVSLYGLVLIEKQSVSYGAINPIESRQVFIRQALVEGQYQPKNAGRRRGKPAPVAAFYSHNLELINGLGDLEAKSRRRDILVDEQVIFDFYDSVIPIDVINRAGFEHWRKKSEESKPKLLYLSRETLMQHAAMEVTEAQFPNELEADGAVYPLSYHFEPGSKDDGVSVRVPVSILHQLPSQRLEWLVPGLLRDKCISLVKGLPKQLRKNFVPVPTFVDRALASMTPADQSLCESLTLQLKRQTMVTIPSDAWNELGLDDFYRFNICVLDERGKVLDSGRDITILRERYRDQVQQSLQTAGSEFERDDILEWNFGNLTETSELKRGSVVMRAYPALEDKLSSVSLRLLDNPSEALALSLQGCTRLLIMAQSKSAKYLRKELLKGKELGLTMAGLGKREQVVEQILLAACYQLGISELDGLPRTQGAFEKALAACEGALIDRAQQIAALLVSILQALVEVKNSQKKSKNQLQLAFAMGDINGQLERLIYPNFLTFTPLLWLQQYPRYFKAMLMRLEKAPSQVQKDKIGIGELADLWQKYDQWLDKHGAHQGFICAELIQYRWMLEELRVSIFAQTLKTHLPVSKKRLNKQWLEVEG